MRGSKALTIQLARQGLDGAEYEFARLLVEDRNNEAQSYVDWLVHIHRHVQLEVSLFKFEYWYKAVMLIQIFAVNWSEKEGR